MKKKSLIIIALLACQIIYSQQKKIEIKYERKKDNSIVFSYKKNVPGSYYLTVKFPRLENSFSSKTYNKVAKYAAGTLFTLKPRDREKGIAFSYNFKYIIGNPNPKINTKISYALPFKEGKSVKIIEANYLGEKYFGNNKPIDWKSFIISSKEPETVYSMRRGVVVEIVNEYQNDTKFNNSFTSKRNSIKVEHNDGTYAIYSGFDKNEIFVKLGQNIYPHTTLGKLSKFDESTYRLSFNVFHYLKNLLDDKKTTLKNRIHKTKYLNPTFYVDNTTKKIEHGKEYIVSFNEEIKLQEFSKREKRKYKKTPEKFQ
ncbi:MAG: hypothetical protein P8I51_10390 [Polaribacter sp.]|jgi:hypothetical protein|nr:hypothetical protein [Polaribacter sp.]MDG1955284.1 hypothetical protein [Polaribacter sp.]MDG2074193.1 hypothetical protein [Polaribacter sp.]